MYRKAIEFALVAFILAASGMSEATNYTFSDDFNTPYDYIANNVYGVDWDGMIGLGTNETIDVMDANITNAPNDANLSGLLYIQSTGGNWDTMSPYGPLLYKEVDGDFVAQVEVKAISCCWGSLVVDHADSGIMARVPNLDDADPGEDHVSLQYFGRWCGHLGRSMDGGAENEFGCSGGTCNDYRWIQLERSGSTFYFRVSTDGKTWQWLADDAEIATITRDDLADIAILQVGVEQCTYNNTTGYVAFDNFSVTSSNPFPEHPFARIPTPADGATDVNYTGSTLRWKEGDYTDVSNGHYLYFSDDLSKVEGRDASVRTILSTTSYELPDLNLTKTYYWCVDEYKTGDPCSPWPGPIWQFSTTDVRATNPNPPDNQRGIDPSIPNLTWTPGNANFVSNQDLYFSDDYIKVLNGDPSVRAAKDLSGNATSYPTPGVPPSLERRTQYFWRVDSNCGSIGLVEGDVWSFRTSYSFEECDEFEYDWDYSIDGIGGTIWDGLIGSECLIWTTTDFNYGKLYIESSNCAWSCESISVLLYVELDGDFSAETEITDYPGLWTPDHSDAVNNNTCGLMARVPNIDDAGDGEDWIALEYFPLWNVGNRISQCGNDDVHTLYQSGNGWNADRFLRMEKREGQFYFFTSTEGVVWQSCLPSPVIRSDMNSIPLQVGLTHAIASSQIGYVEYEYFCYGRDAVEQAHSPLPADGGSLDLMQGILSWLPGDFAQPGNSGQVLYFGTDYDDVNNATLDDPEYRGSTNVTGPDASDRFSYDAAQFETLVFGNTYYWRVDEVNVANPDSPWKGRVWEFTVQSYSTIDDFERYDLLTIPFSIPYEGIRKVWIDGYYSTWRDVLTGGSFVQLNIDPCDGQIGGNTPIGSTEDLALGGAKSMKFYYDNDGKIYWPSRLYGGGVPILNYTTTLKRSEAIAAIDDAARLSAQHESLGLKRDWSGYKLIKISYYGDPANTIVATDRLYIGIDDGDTNPAAPVVVYNPDNTILQHAGWHDWYIKLSDFTDQNANLTTTDIYRIYIGIGNRASPANGGTGAVFIDDIQLLAYSVCIPGSVVGDLNGDCVVSEDDLQVLIEPNDWSGQKNVLSMPIIDLDAASLSLGELTSWTNTGSGGGKFFDANAADSNNPVVEDIEGKRAVVFDTTDLLIWKTNDGSALITTPATLTSDHNDPNDFTVIYEVWNLEVADQEHILTWTRLDGPTGVCAGFCYGRNDAFGAVIHWGWPDMGFDVYEPPAHTWHKIGITYDGTTEVIAVDGIIQSVENKDLALRPEEMVTLGTSYFVSTDPNDNWLGDYGYVNDGLFDMRYSGALASMKVYGSAISPADLALQTGTKTDLYPDNRIDFKDVAVLASRWLVGPVLLGD